MKQLTLSLQFGFDEMGGGKHLDMYSLLTSINIDSRWLQEGPDLNKNITYTSLLVLVKLAGVEI